MGANLNTTFVVDVEATCWEEDQGNKPNEVIEIGICALNIRDRRVYQKSSYVIKPRFTEVSPFCTQLTGWTQAEVDRGADIVDVLDTIRKDFGITRNHTWWSYGEYDRIKLSAIAGMDGSLNALYGLKSSPFDMRAHYNAKTLLAMKFGLKKEMGMSRALDYLDLELEGRHHNGADDAFNIAKIVNKILGPVVPKVSLVKPEPDPAYERLQNSL